MALPYDPNDPFSGGEKVPSLSWKGEPIGTIFTVEILEPPKSLQSRNFDSNLPDYWDAEKTRPKMSAVINVRVLNGPHSVGEERSIWAQIPSSMFIAIKQAQEAVERRLEPGGTLHLKFAKEIPNEKNPRLNHIKQYQAIYEPPTLPPPPAPDPFVTPPVAPAPAATPPAAPAVRPALATWGNPAPVQATTPPVPQPHAAQPTRPRF